MKTQDETEKRARQMRMAAAAFGALMASEKYQQEFKSGFFPPARQ